MKQGDEHEDGQSLRILQNKGCRISSDRTQSISLSVGLNAVASVDLPRTGSEIDQRVA